MPFQQAFCNALRSIGLTFRMRLNFSSRANSSSFSRLVPIVDVRPYREDDAPPPLFEVAVDVTIVLDLLSRSILTTEFIVAGGDCCCCCCLTSPMFLISSLPFLGHESYWSDEIDVGTTDTACESTLVVVGAIVLEVAWFEDDDIDCLNALPGPFYVKYLFINSKLLMNNCIVRNSKILFSVDIYVDFITQNNVLSLFFRVY